MTDELKWAIIELYEGLCNYYPSIYRIGGEAAGKETVRFWKAQLGDTVAPKDIQWFIQTYLGRTMFEATPPKPHQVKLIISKRGDEHFELGVRFDQMMQACYMSLYVKEPGSRLERINEYAIIFEEENIGFAEVGRVASKIKRSSAWRSYPPSMYDIRNLIIRDNFKVDNFETEFGNYCTGITTGCVSAVTRIIGKDNLRLMSLDAQERVFRKIYFSLDEKGWDKVSDIRLSDFSEENQSEVVEVTSRENTLSVFK